MEMSRGFQNIIDEKKEKKRRKKRRRRRRRVIFFLIVIGVLAYTGKLEDLYRAAQNGGGERALYAAREMGTQAAERMPEFRLWLADKLNYIAQFL